MLEQFKKHIEISKQGFTALEQVIAYACSRCGLCAGLCPKESIAMQDTIPTLVGECNRCGLCYQGCPRSFFPLTKVKERWFGPEQTETDIRIGRCVDRFTARSLNDEIFERAAIGGTTSALLHYLLEKKIVAAVLHLESIHKDCFICHHAATRVSTQPGDVLKGARSKNQITPILHDLKKVSDYENFAVVGLSCHVEGLRKLQLMKDDPELRETFPGLAKMADKLIGNLKFVIGINCFSATRYGGIDAMYRHLGIREADVIKYAEDAKKTLYQVLHEGKNFLWFVQDNIMTRDGRFLPFKYVDYLEDMISMGCMVCPSMIVSKEADVSIGVTASDTSLHRFGYNSVFVRNTELNGIMSNMVQEGRLYKRPMWDDKGTLLRKFVEKVLPSKDLMNFRGYIATGRWNPSTELYKRSEPVSKTGILGLQRLYLSQTIKRKMMFEPAVKAIAQAGKHITETI